MILAFNPNYVNPEYLVRLKDEIERNYKCSVYFIEHLDDHAEPIYCVQFTDTEKNK